MITDGDYLPDSEIEVEEDGGKINRIFESGGSAVI